jgi:hypothetical protein
MTLLVLSDQWFLNLDLRYRTFRPESLLRPSMPSPIPSSQFLMLHSRYLYDEELKQNPAEYQQIYDELKVEAALIVIVSRSSTRCSSIDLCFIFFCPYFPSAFHALPSDL